MTKKLNQWTSYTYIFKFLSVFTMIHRNKIQVMNILTNILMIIKKIEKSISYFKTFINDLTKFFQRKEVNFLFCLLFLLFWGGRGIVQKIIFQIRTDGKNETLNCPVRGSLATRVYDSVGNFTEEYHRIKIIKQLLKSGFSQHHMNLHHRIQIGHKGKNSFIPDLVIRNKSEKGYFLVLEVKKDPSKMKEAILYQLNPAIRILSSQYGIYYDGSKGSSCFKNDGSKVQNFNFLDIPTWFYNEWKYS